MSLADKLTSLGLVVAIWLALVGIYRNDLMELLNRTTSLLDSTEEKIAAAWLSENGQNEEVLRRSVLQITASLNRLEDRLIVCRRRMWCKNIGQIEFPEVYDAATLDIEMRDAMTDSERYTRFARAHKSLMQVQIQMDFASDKWHRKVMWF